MSQNPLGKTTQYISQYAPELLFAIQRREKRDELPREFLDFVGEDIWTAYEVSWLNQNGLPQVAIGEFRVNAASENIIESKSLKLYLNSFNQTQFDSKQHVIESLKSDLSKAAQTPVEVKLNSPHEFSNLAVQILKGECIDELPVKIDEYSYNPRLLSCVDNGSEHNDACVNETLISHLLKSNCLITSQPDWASIQISYTGKAIDKESLLKYLVAFRSHNEFHEQCVERIFCDIKKYCSPQKLTVYARYTRRGGLDINPWRSDQPVSIDNIRLARQ